MRNRMSWNLKPLNVTCLLFVVVVLFGCGKSQDSAGKVDNSAASERRSDSSPRVGIVDMQRLSEALGISRQMAEKRRIFWWVIRCELRVLWLPLDQESFRSLLATPDSGNSHYLFLDLARTLCVQSIRTGRQHCSFYRVASRHRGCWITNCCPTF